MTEQYYVYLTQFKEVIGPLKEDTARNYIQRCTRNTSKLNSLMLLKLVENFPGVVDPADIFDDD